MKSYKVLLFIVLAITLLGIVCAFYPSDGVQVGSLNLHFPTLTKVLNPQKQLDVEAFLARQDSVKAELKTKEDSLAHFAQQMDSSEIRFWFPNNDDSFFDPLFAAFEQARSEGRTIRILHYGDSQIESDRMTDRLRVYMQSHFGGGGPGLVPFATLIPSLSVSTYGTGSLVRQSPFGDSTVVRAAGNYGPMVQDYRVVGSATSTISAATHHSRDSRLRQFSQFTMLFNNRPGPLSVTFADRKGSYTDQRECPNEGVQCLSWKLDTATTSVRISVTGNADIYGVMVDDGPGVAVDNIPMRGCSGHQFVQINRDQLAAAYSHMDIGLIILQFGGNAMPYIKGQQAVNSYCLNMVKQIERIRQCCPKAKILFIGPSDMTTTINGELQTYPWLPKMVQSLQTMCNAQGVAYWSIYHAMGGYNSMMAWVGKGLGGSDYIHFTQKGVNIMGDRLAEAFDNMYTIYKMRKEASRLEQEGNAKITQ